VFSVAQTIHCHNSFLNVYINFVSDINNENILLSYVTYRACNIMSVMWIIKVVSVCQNMILAATTMLTVLLQHSFVDLMRLIVYGDRCRVDCMLQLVRAIFRLSLNVCLAALAI
jgi:hypothetical protein